MAKKDIKSPVKALLISGFIFSPEISFDEVLRDVSAKFGKVFRKTEIVPFSWTSYYNREMGEGLLRCLVSFLPLVPQDCLVELKYSAMDIEEKWSTEGKRQVNIDPGLLSLERVVLATTKNYTHRIYLSKGIFADLTLIYKRGSYRPLEWTYPDYKSEMAISFFSRLRKAYLELLRKEKGQ